LICLPLALTLFMEQAQVSLSLTDDEEREDEPDLLPALGAVSELRSRQGDSELVVRVPVTARTKPDAGIVVGHALPASVLELCSCFDSGFKFGGGRDGSGKGEREEGEEEEKEGGELHLVGVLIKSLMDRVGR
jgi:hypothetical protein